MKVESWEILTAFLQSCLSNTSKSADLGFWKLRIFFCPLGKGRVSLIIQKFFYCTTFVGSLPTHSKTQLQYLTSFYCWHAFDITAVGFYLKINFYLKNGLKPNRNQKHLQNFFCFKKTFIDLNLNILGLGF